MDGVIQQRQAYAVLCLHRFRAALCVTAYGDGTAVIRAERFQFQIGDAGGVHFVQAHFHRRACRVVSDEASFAARFDPPEIFFGQIAAQA